MKNFFKKIIQSKPFKIVITVFTTIGSIFIFLYFLFKNSNILNFFKIFNNQKEYKKLKKENDKIIKKVKKDIKKSKKIKKNIENNIETRKNIYNFLNRK